MSRKSTRRKGGSTAEGEAGPAKKKAKVPPGVTWEWEGDGGKWSQFSANHSRLLSEALINGDSDVSVQVAQSVKMKIRFDSMTQTNVGTGWQRNVRCASPSQSGSPDTQTVWEWENDRGEWAWFPPAHQRLLHACKACHVDAVSVETTARKRSRVDLGSMTHEMGRGKKFGVRCSSLAVWEWQDENGQWMKYDIQATRDLENAHSQVGGASVRGARRKNQVAITTGGRSYTVDIGKMEQKNNETGVVRNIRRLSSTAKGSSSDTPTLEVAVETTPTCTSEATPTASTSAGASASASVTAEAETDSVPESDEKNGDGHVTRELQGAGIPVDYVCSQKVGKAHVYSEDGVHWDAMLNQTNLKNNNNKFYLLQLLKDNKTGHYSTWFRWGRVGKTGQHQLTPFKADLESAKDSFRKKFQDKTHNEWDERESFVKKAGKYDMLAMDYKATVEEEEEEEEEGEEDVDTAGTEPKVKAPESCLDERLQALIELICDVQAMEDAVVEMKYDPRKAPLGKLTKDQIKAGYAALKKIDDCISSNQFGDELVKACDQFYTRIPHDFGMRRPPIIRTEAEVKEKLSLLETLGDIEIAMRLLNEGDKKEHPIDRHYHGLHCKLEPLDAEDDVVQLVRQYIRQTHAATHITYTLTVKEVFEMEKEGEDENFKDMGNRQLLWHGSRLTNWVGILSQGLRVAPPEAPVTGYMFGKGVYFADMCSKSANYCFASRARQDGLLILCDVALGQTNDLLAADYHADQLPRGKHSTRGLGSVAPDPKQSKKLPDGCLVPLGTSTQTGVHNPHGYTLNYNEYAIYDVNQIKMRYLVRVKFNFK
ncbi:Poly [ADP-ribose] polymerase 2 [Geodia barretti]|uniref:Poly [ADP-ribose] polymerase n=1 Tax=Geodia barretti TaxID=519541 RepID=A0AA35X973_GEOBA|nr:Poly [ADP-ribose] polymerase 2 [Geodia barretti]